MMLYALIYGILMKTQERCGKNGTEAMAAAAEKGGPRPTSRCPLRTILAVAGAWEVGVIHRTHATAE